MEENKITFKDLGLADTLMEGLDAMGFETPTPIQSAAIPLILAGNDIIASAQTGTGKTAAFLLPVMDHIVRNPSENIRALVICPTRELATQIDQQVEGFSYFTSVSSIPVYGGSGPEEFRREKKAMTSGVDIVVATPGRLISHLNLGYVDFSKLDFLILDEADRMLDMGFYNDIMRIIKHTNPERRGLLFSATMPKKIVDLSKSILKNPERVNIALSKPAKGITQVAYMAHNKQKIALITELIEKRKDELNRVIMFAGTKKMVSEVYRELRRKKIPCASISSDLEQSERESVLLDFKTGKAPFLVATDVVSRGIDITGIDLVVNFDVPSDAEDYVHRIGRTARADSTGMAITLINSEDVHKFQRIEQLIEMEIVKMPPPEHLGPGPAYEARKGGGGKGRHHGKGGRNKGGHGKGGSRKKFYKGKGKPGGGKPQGGSKS